jgi:hypothetical protein
MRPTVVTSASKISTNVPTFANGKLLSESVCTSGSTVTTAKSDLFLLQIFAEAKVLQGRQPH